MLNNHTYPTRIPKNILDIIDSIKLELKRDNIKVSKKQIWQELIKNTDTNKIIENFKYKRNKKVHNMLNNDFWNF